MYTGSIVFQKRIMKMFWVKLRCFYHLLKSKSYIIVHQHKYTLLRWETEQENMRHYILKEKNALEYWEFQQNKNSRVSEMPK